jgi:glycosyltransferase involved in cell wall biosynthesis
MNEKISIVIPLFNKESTIQACIQSILKQTFQNFEIVIINDGSTDNSLANAALIPDPRIHIFTQKNSGVSSARNYGIEKSSNDLIAFLDADDFWLPNFLECIHSLFTDYPEAQWAATGYFISIKNRNPYKNIINCAPKDFSRGIINSYFEICATSDPLVHASAVCIKKHAIKLIGGFPLGVYSGEDLLTWAKLACNFPLAYDVKPMVNFLVSGIDRKPDPTYFVAIELAKLNKMYPSLPGLSKYLSLWYRMQSVAAQSNNNLFFAHKMSFLSLRYNFFNIKNIYVFVLSFIPKIFANKLDTSLRFLRELISENSNVH